MFEIGQEIVYPMHGAGRIVSIEKQEFLGEIKEYYVMHLGGDGMKLMIPVDNAENLGLREVMSEQELLCAMAALKGESTDISENWNHRYRSNMEKLKSGFIADVIDVVRDLSIRNKEKGLSTGEKKMFENALEIFLSEMVLSLKIQRERALERISEYLE